MENLTPKEQDSLPSAAPSPKKGIPFWVFDLLLVLVLLAGAYLRATGLYWGEYQYLHPDERFLVWVGTDISPTKLIDTPNGPEKVWISLSEYFDTANSPLNPNNRGHGFYVYGTLPMFVTRFAVEWVFGHTGFDVMTQMGRAFSALTDLLTILLVYLIAKRIYDRRVGLLAAAFSAAAVLQIQQAHFFTMDTFSNFFAYLAIYFAVRIMTDPRTWPWGAPLETEPPGERELSNSLINSPSGEVENLSETATIPETSTDATSLRKQILGFFRHPLFWLSIAFGLAYGAAMASKLSIYPIALLLPIAVAIRISRMPRSEWIQRALQALVYLAIAGMVSIFVFRIAQPYAFSGPGFLGVKLNPAWLAQIREQRNQATAEVDFPPAMQWARRPIWFSSQNLTLWGLGLPLGLLAWAGFLWAGWDMLKGRWRTHLLLWGWTAIYFAWQSLALNPTMRYQLPIYPVLAIFAAWGVVSLWDLGKSKLSGSSTSGFWRRIRWPRLLAFLIGGVVLAATFAYAYAFTGIYNRPITRIEGSRWIYQNIPGPINLHIETDEGLVNQPLPFPYNSSIMARAPYIVNFTPQSNGVLSEIYLPKVQSQRPTTETANLELKILASDGSVLGSRSFTVDTSQIDPQGTAYTLKLDQPIALEKGQGYALQLEALGEPPTALLDMNTTLGFINENGDQVNYPAFQINDPNWLRLASKTTFTAPENGVVVDIFLPVDDRPLVTDEAVNMLVTIQDENNTIEPSLENLTAELVTQDDTRGPGYLFRLPTPVYLNAGQRVILSMTLPENRVALTLSGAGIANEGDWDDGMPLRIDGYDGFGGIYPLDLNFNMYWDDNPEKLDRFLRILDQTDYIVITSNRQWGSLPRIPERFPMTTLYYRDLLGCPPEKDIVWCYRVAESGKFKGNLGFELVKTFESDPQIGPLKINDQFAEEAFTVYDHPKVFIFQKTADYNQQQVSAILGSVDFSKVIRLPPLKFKSYPADLMLPLQRWVEQQMGGTWSKLFNTQTWQNRSQIVGTLLWYISLAVLGLLVYPILRLAFPGLSDKGYPLARTAGLLILSYVVWVAGSYGVPFTRTTISIVLLLLLILGGVLAYIQRAELGNEWRRNKRYYSGRTNFFRPR